MADPPRRVAIQALKARLETITVANGYKTTVDTVSRLLKTWSEVGNESRIYIGIMAKREDYEYQPSDNVRVVFMVELICHVQGQDSAAARANKLDDLIDDIMRANDLDPNLTVATVPSVTMWRPVWSDSDEEDEYGGSTARVSLQLVYHRSQGGS